MMEDSEVLEARRATAYHEAGHAVVAMCVGRSLEKVTITPGQTQVGMSTLGHCKVQKGRGRPSKDALEDEVLILFAGMAAEAKHTGEYCRAGASQDLRLIRKLISSRNTGERQIERLERRLLDKTENLLEDENVWLAVERVADLLVEQETISGRAVRHIYETSVKE